MNGAISVINGGSSSIKFSLFRSDNEDLELVFQGQAEGIGVAPRFVAKNPKGDILAEKTWSNGPDVNHESLMAYIIGWIREHRQKLNLALIGVGHRVVHGGQAYSRPVIVDENVLHTLESFISLAPLHQPHNLSPIRAVAKLIPGIRQVACFDTAFHAANPSVAQIFALPRALTDEGIRRYGFHGLSYEYISRQLPAYDPEAARGRVVVAHLGSGASMCAIANGKSIASTMGFSAVDGLPMGTRTGALDPGVLLYLMEEKGMDAKAIGKLLYTESGLLGISGISNDMRVLEESDDPRAKEAIALFVYRIQRELGSLAAALGGLDALVFTAGIGEHSSSLRAAVCEGARWLGIRLDLGLNREGGPRISTPESAVSVWVIPTNEELMIAAHTRDAIAAC